MNSADILEIVVKSLQEIIRSDRTNIYYLLYYSVIEAILMAVIPLTSAFIINSVMAHATISILALSVVVISIFVMIMFLQILKEMMIEKFEQWIFVKNAIEVADLSMEQRGKLDQESIDKYMNYFFDVLSLQKLFPVLILNGSALVVKVIISLVLLLLFDKALFALGMFFILFFVTIVLFIGRDAPQRAVVRSNAKHDAIYFLQNIPMQTNKTKKKIVRKLDKLLVEYVNARRKMFKVIVKQLSLTFFIEGVILSTFFIVGGYMVFQGVIPIGEFIASEIIIISVTGTLREFMKQIDYIYDMIEGIYKIKKLSNVLGIEK